MAENWPPNIVQPVITEHPQHRLNISESNTEDNTKKITSNRGDIIPHVPTELQKYYHIVSRDTFMDHATIALSKFLDTVNGEQYQLIYVLNNPEGDNGEKNIRKSEHWLTGEFLKKYKEFQPIRPVQHDHETFSSKETIQDNLLIMDDASYSGKQLGNFLEDLLKKTVKF